MPDAEERLEASLELLRQRTLVGVVLARENIAELRLVRLPGGKIELPDRERPLERRGTAEQRQVLRPRSNRSHDGRLSRIASAFFPMNARSSQKESISASDTRCPHGSSMNSSARRSVSGRMVGTWG